MFVCDERRRVAWTERNVTEFTRFLEKLGELHDNTLSRQDFVVPLGATYRSIDSNAYNELEGCRTEALV